MKRVAQHVPGVDWKTRRNPARAQLNFAEVAVLEFLSLFPDGVEAEWPEVVARIAELRDRRQVSLDRIQRVVVAERRKPELRDNLDRLITDLAGA